MNNNKFVASLVTMDTIDFAYPCFHQGQTWNGWAMPYSRLKYAKLVAQEFNGKYDEQKDAFIFDDQGDEDVFISQIIKIRGKDVKVYAIGAGTWYWNTTDSMKLFQAYGSEDFCNAGKHMTTESLYSEIHCYDKEEVVKIHALEIGQTWKSPDYGSNHTVTRTQ